MAQPPGFTWINKPLLAAMAEPIDADDLHWLRQHGIQVMISLTETPLAREAINEAGLLLVHVPVQDMAAPSQAQLDHCLNTIRKANARSLGVGVHCTAGLGRTGTILAAYFVAEGLAANDAIARVRRLRPGSIETQEQVDAILNFARRRLPERDVE